MIAVPLSQQQGEERTVNKGRLKLRAAQQKKADADASSSPSPVRQGPNLDHAAVEHEGPESPLPSGRHDVLQLQAATPPPATAGLDRKAGGGGDRSSNPSTRSKNWDALRSMAARAVPVGRAVQGLQQEMRARAQGLGQLRPDTRVWLHVDAYGAPLAAGVKAEAEGASRPTTHDSGWRTLLTYYRQRLWLLMTESDSSPAAYVVSLLIMGAILLSTIAFCLETVPAYSVERSPGANQAFVIIETVTVQIFAADYLLRLLSCPHLLQFLIAPLNVIDLISVVPWYIELAMEGSGMEGTAVFRVLRLLRVFRVFKLGARYRKLLVVTDALGESLDMLVLMAFFVSLIVVLAASLIFFAERGTYDEELGYYVREHEKATRADGSPIVSPFESVPAGFWWAIVTLMTVGYGDVLPISVGGRFIAAFTMLCGILAIALPVAVIGTNFSNKWAEYGKRSAKGDAMPASPNLEKLAAVLDEHKKNVADLLEMLQAAVDKLSDLESEVRERGELRHEEIESLLRQRAPEPRVAAAAREVVACLCHLGLGLAAAAAAAPPGGGGGGGGVGGGGGGGSAGGPVAESREEEGDVGELRVHSMTEQGPDASQRGQLLPTPSRINTAAAASAFAAAGAGPDVDDAEPPAAVAAGSAADAAAARRAQHPPQPAPSRPQQQHHSSSAPPLPPPPPQQQQLPYALPHMVSMRSGANTVSVADSLRTAASNVRLRRHIGAAAVLPLAPSAPLERGAAAAAAWGGGPPGLAAGASAYGFGAGGVTFEADGTLPEPCAPTAARLRDALAELEGTHLYDRMLSEADEALALEKDVREAWTQLVKVLHACALLHSYLLPDTLELMRGQYRQLGTLGKEAKELRARLDLLEEGLGALGDVIDRKDVVMHVVGSRKSSATGQKAPGSRDGSVAAAAAGGAPASAPSGASPDASRRNMVTAVLQKMNSVKPAPLPPRPPSRQQQPHQQPPAAAAPGSASGSARSGAVDAAAAAALPPPGQSDTQALGGLRAASRRGVGAEAGVVEGAEEELDAQGAAEGPGASGLPVGRTLNSRPASTVQRAAATPAELEASGSPAPTPVAPAALGAGAAAGSRSSRAWSSVEGTRGEAEAEAEAQAAAAAGPGGAVSRAGSGREEEAVVALHPPPAHVRSASAGSGSGVGSRTASRTGLTPGGGVDGV